MRFDLGPTVRLGAIVLIAICCFAQPPSSDSRDAITIEGRVFDVAGVPLANALIQAYNLVQSPSPPAIRTARTDNMGAFTIKGLDVGRAVITAERSGYIRKTYLSPLVLASGQHLKNINLSLQREALLGGRVLDEDGDKFRNAQVSIGHWIFAGGVKRWAVVATSTTGADGAFLIGGLASGTYYIMATPESFMRRQLEANAISDERTYVPTYYPRAIHVSDALPVSVPSGGQLANIEIRIQTPRVFKISGTISDNTGVLGSGVPLILFPRGGVIPSNQRSPVFPEGKFEFRDLIPGDYIIQSALGGANTRQGRLEITLGDRDIRGLELSLRPPLELRGHLSTEGIDLSKETKSNGPPTTIVLLGNEGLLTIPQKSAQVSGDGKFLITGLAAAEYRIMVENLPSGSYVKSIRLGPQEIDNRTFTLRPETSDTLAIVLSPTAGEIGGLINDSTGRGRGETAVSLWRDYGGGPGVQEEAATTRTDGQGNFLFAHVAPGKYFVASWEETDPGFLQNAVNFATFRKLFEGQALHVEVTNSSKLNVNPKVISRSATEAQLSFVP